MPRRSCVELDHAIHRLVGVHVSVLPVRSGWCLNDGDAFPGKPERRLTDRPRSAGPSCPVPVPRCDDAREAADVEGTHLVNAGKARPQLSRDGSRNAPVSVPRSDSGWANRWANRGRIGPNGPVSPLPVIPPLHVFAGISTLSASQTPCFIRERSLLETVARRMKTRSDTRTTPPPSRRRRRRAELRSGRQARAVSSPAHDRDWRKPR
jgi:hypothetical protein